MPGRWILACACVAIAGCGSDAGLESTAAEALHDDVAAVRSAAREGDRDRALQALDRMRDRIERAESAGELGDAEAAALRQGVRRAERRVESEIAEPAATATPDPTPPAEPPPPPEAEPDGGDDAEGEEPGPGKGKGKGKAKGEGGDEEGDD